MMSQFMAQGGQGISGKAIKWRETSVNVPFSLFSGNFKMFSNVSGPTVLVSRLPTEADGAPGDERKTLPRSSSNLSTFTAQGKFSPSFFA